MIKTSEEIEVLSEISKQLREEGSHKSLAATARDMSRGQFGNDQDDSIGAVKLMMDALAHMLVQSPLRPKCCASCELEYLRNQMQVLAYCYSGTVYEEKSDGKP
jgi:hypothetical protein